MKGHSRGTKRRAQATSRTDYERAIKFDPAGVVCSRCGKLNDLWDDIGWFYQDVKEKGYRPICRKCRNGPFIGER